MKKLFFHLHICLGLSLLTVIIVNEANPHMNFLGGLPATVLISSFLLVTLVNIVFLIIESGHKN